MHALKSLKMKVYSSLHPSECVVDEEQVGQLRLELNGEIQRSTELQKKLKTSSGSNEPTIVVRGESEKGPLHSAAVRMYEELTNLLITKIREKPNPLKPGTNIKIFDCLYTPRSVDEPREALISAFPSQICHAELSSLI